MCRCIYFVNDWYHFSTREYKGQSLVDVIISEVGVAISDVLLTSSDDEFTSVIVLCSGLDSVTFVLFRNRCHRRLTIYAFSKTFILTQVLQFWKGFLQIFGYQICLLMSYMSYNNFITCIKSYLEIIFNHISVKMITCCRFYIMIGHLRGNFFPGNAMVNGEHKLSRLILG